MWLFVFFKLLNFVLFFNFIYYLLNFWPGWVLVAVRAFL